MQSHYALVAFLAAENVNVVRRVLIFEDLPGFRAEPLLVVIAVIDKDSLLSVKCLVVQTINLRPTD